MVSLGWLVAAVIACVYVCVSGQTLNGLDLDRHFVKVDPDTKALSDFLSKLEITTSCTEKEPCVLDVQRLPSHIAAIDVAMAISLPIGVLNPLPLACWDVRDGDPTYPQSTNYSCADAPAEQEFKCPRCFPSMAWPANYCPHVSQSSDAKSFCVDHRSNVFREGQFTVYDAKMRLALGGLRVERLVPGVGDHGAWLAEKQAAFHWQRAYKISVPDSVLSANAQHKVENLDMEIDGSGNPSYNTVSIDSEPRGPVRPSRVTLDLSLLRKGEGSFVLALSFGLNGAHCGSEVTSWGAPCEKGHVSLDHDIPRYISPMDIPPRYSLGTMDWDLLPPALDNPTYVRRLEYPWFFIQLFPRVGYGSDSGNLYLPLTFDDNNAYQISCGACTLGKLTGLSDVVRKAINRVTFNMFGFTLYRDLIKFFDGYDFETFLRKPLKERGPDGFVNQLLGTVYDGVHYYVRPTAAQGSAGDLVLLREEEDKVTTSYVGFERLTVDYGTKLFNSTVKYVNDKLRLFEDGDLVVNNLIRQLLPSGTLTVSDPRRPIQGVELDADATKVTIETPLFNIDVKVVKYSVSGLDSFDDTFSLLRLAAVRTHLQAVWLICASTRVLHFGSAVLVSAVRCKVC
jgi:hypothetical protein